MNQVLNNLRSPISSEVTPDGARSRKCWVSGSSKRTESFYDAFALKSNGHDLARQHELHQRLIKGFSLVLKVVLSK